LYPRIGRQRHIGLLNRYEPVTPSPAPEVSRQESAHLLNRDLCP